MRLAVAAKPLSEVCRHDADAALVFEPVLVFRPQQAIELVHVSRVGGREPPAHVGSTGVPVGYGGIDAEQVDFGERQVAHVLDLLDAEIAPRSEEHTSELQSQSNLVCRLLLEKKNNPSPTITRHAQSLSSWTRLQRRG